MVIVNVFNRQKKMAISSSQVQSIVTFLLQKSRKACDEIALSFVSKKAISKLHALFFNDPTPTDCMTFPFDSPGEGGYTFLGEAYICPEVALEYSEENSLDPYRELTLYVVHTLLHLLGYDDIDPKERTKMRKAEKRWMGYLDEQSLCLKKPLIL